MDRVSDGYRAAVALSFQIRVVLFTGVMPRYGHAIIFIVCIRKKRNIFK
jgi:hypothetical protein